MHLALQVNEYGLAWCHVSVKFVRGAFQRHRLAGQHHRALAHAHAQGANAKRITKSQHAVAGNQRNHRVRALDASVDLAHRFKNIMGLQRQATRSLANFMCQHVEQDF